ncbi:MAG: GNAT family N-acetyltransferase [Acidimicrobiales bacterium]|jgi:GNAT superfamily N-acetyltransferase
MPTWRTSDSAAETPGETIVRDAEVGDADEIAEAHVRAWQIAYRGIMPDRYLDELSEDMAGQRQRRRVHLAAPDNPRVFNLVAERDGTVVGWLAAGPCRDEDHHETQAEVWAVYVHPDAWRTGAGGALMTAATERLAAQGYTEASLWVFEANARARRFYERYGWRTDGATEIYERGGGQAIEIRYRRPLV